MHDPRIGRFFAVDPLKAKYPHNSPYAFSENRVIDAVELEGLESAVLSGNAIDANFKGQLGLGDITFDVDYSTVKGVVSFDLSVPKNADVKAQIESQYGELNDGWTIIITADPIKIETVHEFPVYDKYGNETKAAYVTVTTGIAGTVTVFDENNKLVQSSPWQNTTSESHYEVKGSGGNGPKETEGIEWEVDLNVDPSDVPSGESEPAPALHGIVTFDREEDGIKYYKVDSVYDKGDGEPERRRMGTIFVRSDSTAGYVDGSFSNAPLREKVE